MSEGLFKVGLVSLPFWRGHMADEIGDRGAEGELRAVGILEPELVVADNAAAV